MSKVIHRISLPCVTGTVVWMLHYTIDDWVAEVHVRTGHVNLGTKNHLPGLYVAAVHFAEKSQAFFCRTVTVRAVLSGLGGCTFLSGNLLRCLFVNVCAAGFYEMQ